MVNDDENGEVEYWIVGSLKPTTKNWRALPSISAENLTKPDLEIVVLAPSILSSDKEC
jgi:hypothetical protein